MAARTPDASKRTRQRQLDDVREESTVCKRCDLWRIGTQTVFGEGPIDADVMFIGEQPGDVEDVQGRPFVGPAGRLLQAALVEAGLSAVSAYLTNAVKHFKWEPRGKRRLHMRPNTAELLACQFWLEQEIAKVKPKVLVALGASAVRAVLGSKVKVLRDRGRWMPSTWGPDVLVTVHPSSVLRAQDSESRQQGMRDLVADLRQVRTRLNK
jgi:uracil-DNA glycosylase